MPPSSGRQSSRALDGRASRGRTARATASATSSFCRRRVDEHPVGLARLATIALAHAREEREVALEDVPVGGLALHAGLGRDVEEHSHRRRWQGPLRLVQPGAIQAVRLAVRDARRAVAVADDDVARRARDRAAACI